MLTIGCHLSTEKGFLHMAEETASINANTFQYFTRNPRGGAVRELKEKDIDAYKEYAAGHGIKTIVGYAPYDIEPSSPDVAKQDFAKSVISEDLARMEEIPGQMYLVRPGTGTGATEEEQIANICKVFNEALNPSIGSKVLLDTMAGEGHQIGFKFEQLAKMLDGIKMGNKMGVCLDASAVWAAGYDIKNNLDGVLDQFDKAIGLDRLCVIHLNDPKEPLGGRADRHARIGEGEIGFDALAAMVNSPRLANVVFILEEPDSDLVIYERDVEKFQAAYKG